MSDQEFRPVIYLNTQCPFCLKVRLFLLESGLRDRVELRQFDPGSPEETTIREELAPHFEKVSFPSAQLKPGEYINESDAIIGRLAADAGIDPGALPVLASYSEVALARLIQLFRENAELKQQRS